LVIHTHPHACSAPPPTIAIPSWHTGAVGRRQAVRLRPVLPRAGRLQTEPAPRSSRMNAASGMARDELLPRRSAEGAAHTWWHLAWSSTGRWWSPPLSVHLLYVAVADATLDPGLFRPEIIAIDIAIVPPFFLQHCQTKKSNSPESSATYVGNATHQTHGKNNNSPLLPGNMQHATDKRRAHVQSCHAPSVAGGQQLMHHC